MDVALGLTALVIAGLGLLTAVIKFAMDLYKTTKDTNKVMQEIHIIVNSRFDEALARIDQLTGALESAGTVVPKAPVGDQDGG